MSRSLAITICLTMASSAFGANINSSHATKVLPLDGQHGMQLKTPATSQYMAGRLIVKLMPGETLDAIASTLDALSASSMTPVFPGQMVKNNKGEVDLSRYYYVEYSSPVDAFAAAADLSALPEVNFAEPRFIYPLEESSVFTPNDPSFGSQWDLQRFRRRLRGTLPRATRLW